MAQPDPPSDSIPAAPVALAYASPGADAPPRLRAGTWMVVLGGVGILMGVAAAGVGQTTWGYVLFKDLPMGSTLRRLNLRQQGVVLACWATICATWVVVGASIGPGRRRAATVAAVLTVLAVSFWSIGTVWSVYLLAPKVAEGEATATSAMALAVALFWVWYNGRLTTGGALAVALAAVAMTGVFALAVDPYSVHPGDTRVPIVIGLMSALHVLAHSLVLRSLRRGH